MTSLNANSLASALVALSPKNPSAVEGLRPLYADDVVFRDPIQVVHGVDDFIAMNERLLRRLRRLEWTVLATFERDNEIAIEWRMQAAAKLGPSLSVEGVTRAKTRGGKVYDHRDYWDLGELVASMVPGGERILLALRAPFA